MIRYIATALLFVVVPEALHAEPGDLQPATYDQLDVPQSIEQVHFEKRPTGTGDRVDQVMRVALALESTVRKGDQVLDTNSRHMERIQQRAMIAEEVVDGHAVAARVRFLKSERVTDGAEPDVHPITGKTYLCRRERDEPLVITREDGSIPGPEEFTIVSESMDALGKPNLLADFFADRTVSVGEIIELPEEIGEGLLGSSDRLGKVSRFALTLAELTQRDGARVARFAVDIKSRGDQNAQMQLVVTGTIDLEVETCRTLGLEFTGPLAMTTSFGSYSQTQTTQVSGKLSMKMSAAYDDR
ncbi:MAG: hypothetical protein ACR2NU_08675 [Aeoliella sp.]